MMTATDNPDLTNQPDSKAGKAPPSPFAAVPEKAPSPFSAVPDASTSPFSPSPEKSTEIQTPSAQKPALAKPALSVVQEGHERPNGSFRPAKIPEKRKQESPFQLVDSPDGFGAQPPLQGVPVSPFEAAFAAPVPPFIPAGDFHGYAPGQPPQPFVNHPYGGNPYYVPHLAYPTQPPFHTSTAAAHASMMHHSHPPAHSYAPTPENASVRQIELRAIFGVDHEMGVNEIIQRCRTLPGIQNIAFIGGQDTNTVESLKTLISDLGYDSGQLRICAGQTPIEFIHEASVLLAVQTDGSNFPAGVRETLMIVARELSRLA